MAPVELLSEFVLQGCSAGALATYAWADQVMDYIRGKNPRIKYWALPDSAFYVDYNSLRTGDSDYKLQMKALYETVNDEGIYFPQEGCV
jgi:hypothetical protein